MPIVTTACIAEKWVVVRCVVAITLLLRIREDRVHPEKAAP